MYTIAIVDDKKEHIQQMKKIILEMKTSFQMKEYTQPEHFLQEIESFPKNTIFILDIMLNQINGIDIATHILQIHPLAQIIFISSYLEKATEVYEVDHCYFVYKPEMENKLSNAIHKAIDKMESLKKTLHVQLKDKIKIISLCDIIYFERDKRTTYIHCLHEQIKTGIKIDEFLNFLPSSFVRCHHSYIINLDTVTEYKRDHFLLMNQIVIPISRSYYQNTKRQFNQYLLQKH